MSAAEADFLEAAGKIKLNWHQDRALSDLEHFIMCEIGGYGSGKSQITPLRMWKMSSQPGQVEQRHGLFSNTVQQLNEGLLPDIFEWLDKIGMDHEMGSRPPAVWVKEWDAAGIRYPHRGPRSPHTLILRSGLHYVCAGLAQKAFMRLKGFRFGTAKIDEVTELESPEPIRYILPRVRCGEVWSGRCEALHHHFLELSGNPPDPRQPHWIRGWIKQHCRDERERLANGEPPFFEYVRSSTLDNVDNVGDAYVDRLRKGLDKGTAEAFISGSLEQVASSTTYDSWGRHCVFPVDYDPRATLLLSMDFNVMPAASTLGHDLDESEVPHRFRGSDQSYTGVWGEFAGRRNMTAVQHFRALMSGDADAGGHWPKNFKGLLQHQGPIYCYGDATGHMRRSESEDLRSAWQQVNEVASALGHRWHFQVPRSNPTQYDSITLLNSKMTSDSGEVTYFVAPWCVELIADFEMTVPKRDGSEWIDKRIDLGRTHWQDCERYKVWARYPNARKDNLRQFRRQVKQVTIQSPLLSLGGLPPALGSRIL